MRRVITIRIEIPDGLDVRLGPPLEQDAGEQLPPPRGAYGPVAVVALPATRNGTSLDACPIHRLPWRTVPAGVSKKTGRGYAAFACCPEPGCDQRPQ
jgi:hypothetical protein